MFFLVYQIRWFLKDVFNEMLGFEAEGGPEIDAKSNKKSRPSEVAEKNAKMVPKVSQKWSKKLSKSNKKTIQKIKPKIDTKKHGFWCFALLPRPWRMTLTHGFWCFALCRRPLRMPWRTLGGPSHRPSVPMLTSEHEDRRGNLKGPPLPRPDNRSEIDSKSR